MSRLIFSLFFIAAYLFTSEVSRTAEGSSARAQALDMVTDKQVAVLQFPEHVTSLSRTHENSLKNFIKRNGKKVDRKIIIAAWPDNDTVDERDHSPGANAISLADRRGERVGEYLREQGFANFQLLNMSSLDNVREVSEVVMSELINKGGPARVVVLIN